MINSTIIRKVEQNEVEVLVALATQIFLEAFAEHNSKSDMQDYVKSNLSIRQLTKELSTKGSRFFFADYRGQVVGYLKINFKNAQTEKVDFESLEIERIYLLREFYGSGVARLLLDKAISLANANYISTIWLGVWEKNSRAIQFYLNQGFEAFGHHSFTLGSEQQVDCLMKLNIHR